MMLATSAVVMISTVAGVPATAVVFTAVDVPGVPAEAKVSAVTAFLLLLTSLLLIVFPMFLAVRSVVGILAGFGFPAVVGIPAVAGVPNMVKISSVYVVSTGSCTLRLVSHDVLVVFFTALSPSVYVVLSAVHLSGVPAVVGIPSCSSCLFSAVGPAVDVFLSMLLHPWSPSWLESLLCLPSLLLLRSLLSVVCNVPGGPCSCLCPCCYWFPCCCCLSGVPAVASRL